ncbi:MAG TPA: CYTH domain-containing protein [Methylorubrum populi]|uniref:CYTH domain-containing protein n=1 Tax=Methylorubrum populi TaxID=223967 RepID=A0A921DZ08_9HYPH|nr:CYTH domain-containing protein [Methylorubrum populi]
MRFEVERKFLVADDRWRAEVVSQQKLTDGLIGQFDLGKVRVRLDEGRAWLTVKGARVGLGRPEFEYEIPRVDAEAMLSLVCDTCLIEKTRHCVPHGGHVWEIDVYEGALAGMILAEVELEHEEEPFERPDWLGPEVTGDLRFRQSALLRRSGEAGRALSPADVLAEPL